MPQQKIPNIFHIIYFGGREFHFVNYLSILSIARVNEPTQIFLYTDQQPNGEWWEKSKHLVTIVEYMPPTMVAGQEIIHPAHQADVARLEILHQHGGVYLDLDVICRRPFSPLFEHTVVLGKEIVNEKTVGICSAVILAQPQALFLERWLDGYDPSLSLWRGFRSKGYDKYYSEMTTKYAYFLANIYPEEVTLEPSESFFYPNYSDEELEEFFGKQDTENTFDDAYCHHLWSNAAWDRYLKNISPEGLVNSSTPFALLARNILNQED